MNEMLNTVFWFMGVIFTCVVLLSLLRFMYDMCLTLLVGETFNPQRFHDEAGRLLDGKPLTEDAPAMEAVCDQLMTKFSNVNSIVYNISDDASSVEFVVFTNDLKKYNVQVTKE